MIIVMMLVFEKLRFQNVFRPHSNSELAFLYSSGVKSDLEKLRFRNGLASMEGRPNLRFQISPASSDGDLIICTLVLCSGTL